MKIACLVLCFAAVAIALPSETLPGEIVALEAAFGEYAAEFNKTYDSDAAYNEAMLAFNASLNSINELNALEGGNVYGLTKFSDIPQAEFQRRYLTYKPSNETAGIPLIEVCHPQAQLHVLSPGLGCRGTF